MDELETLLILLKKYGVTSYAKGDLMLELSDVPTDEPGETELLIEHMSIDESI